MNFAERFPALFATANMMSTSGGTTTYTPEEFNTLLARHSLKDLEAAEAFLRPLSKEQREFIACPVEEPEDEEATGFTFQEALDCPASNALGVLYGF